MALGGRDLGDQLRSILKPLRKCDIGKGGGIIEKSFFSIFGLRIGLGIEFSQSHACQSYFLKSEGLENQ